jgi:hypothetical protein
MEEAMPPGRRMSVLVRETVLWLGLVVGMWLYSYQFDGEFKAYDWGPVAWPRAIMIAIAVIALIHLATQAMLIRRAARVVSPPRESGASSPITADEYRPGANARTFAAFVVPLIYVWLMPHAGYFATTPLFLIVYMLVYRERNWRYMLLTAILLYVVSLLVFSKLLFVPLPTGTWPGFYDFSNWLLEALRAL